MSGPALAVLIAVVAVAVVVRRLRGEPLNLRDLVVPPLVLTALGLWALRHVEDLTPTDVVWVAAGSLLGMALGAVRATTIQVFTRDGVLWQRYTGWTFLVIVGSLVVMAGFGFLAVAMGMHEAARPIQLSVGVGFLGESLVMVRKGMATGIPFAPERRHR
ncbi:Protein of unknown function (DUF1453) [Streptoalloteichus tenebrarius]|uniref:DUF1453 domain-containing protein n=1 Tax=Streptoalloteichus tenebrarius (strain ATCC 17920 / DSM 40477 / JCM 4838 / CBS 697.72 / NBRC 16177 / NCIMB 11028 / NRRL B-12390 / A12253. 1 / ISP 5477) TaxID=1933 RepID=A0ABT1HUX3_STRSD|nr:CcdC protein domain-containing protein [Streptoalloteichus tenebrarius]MCP2259320.1 Protein of unknown function (DUF1453) [Streptoalloteichus tenebrarius]BFE99083.1 hypothetical protein GCM10020241_07590 [Streptoalloteichus tenebrarius]